jgi:hypothetical protein
VGGSSGLRSGMALMLLVGVASVDEENACPGSDENAAGCGGGAERGRYGSESGGADGRATCAAEGGGE